jgi:hypothetical protein
MRTLALAFQLERFYTAVESVLSRILRTIDGDVPAGVYSHAEILRAASVEVEGLRPAVLTEEATDLLRELSASDTTRVTATTWHPSASALASS